MKFMTATRKMFTQTFFLGWTTLAVWTVLDVYRCADSSLNHLFPLFVTNFLMILPLAFASAFLSLALTSPLVVSWRKLLGQRKPTTEVVLILPYVIVVVIVSVHLSLYTGDWASKNFRQAEYRYLAVGLTAMATLVSAYALYPLVGQLLRWGLLKSGLWTRFPTGRMFELVILCLGSSLFIWLLPKTISILDSVDLGVLWYLHWFGIACIAVYFWADECPRPSRRAWLFTFVILLSSPFVVQGVTSADVAVSSVTMIERTSLLSKRSLQFYRWLTDGDGDGVSDQFGGHDCDDDNPSVRPGRLDLPNNQQDENCSGKAFSLRDVPLRVPQPVTKKTAKQYNVIVLTVDALRYDVVDSDMPNLKALAESSVWFENAYSHSATTYWSMASLMTSKLPSQLEMGRDQTPVSRETLLAEVLGRSGWMPYLLSNVTIFFVRGLSQGVPGPQRDYSTSHFTVHGEKPGAEHLTTQIFKKLDHWQKSSRDKPFFLWAHHFDAHDPYFEVPGFPSEEMSDFGRYRAIVRSIDAQIGRLTTELKKRGLWEETILVITSDHGEEFGEHGGRFHGKTLYEEMTRVPLLMRVPDLDGRRIVTPIGQREVAPTILGLVGIRGPKSFTGRDLSQALRSGSEIPSVDVFMETLPDSNYGKHLLGLRRGSMKGILDVSSNRVELYDLSKDPHERENLSGEEIPLAKDLFQQLDIHLHRLAFGKTGARVPLGTPRNYRKVISSDSRTLPK